MSEGSPQVHRLIAERWSPYAFARRTIPRGDIASLFEAATGVAIGYADASTTDLPEAVRARDANRRPRKPLDEIVFAPA